MVIAVGTAAKARAPAGRSPTGGTPTLAIQRNAAARNDHVDARMVVSIGTSKWDFAPFRGFWSPHVRFGGSQSRLKAQGCAWDCLGETDIAVENAAVDRQVDEFHFECQKRVR